MSSSRYPIVVQGEASETDSDDEVYITSLTSHQTTTGGSKVPGEASETDSEDDPQQAIRTSVMALESAQILKRELPPLIVVRDNPDVQSIVEDRPSPSHKPHGGDTLLQQKLQESNSRLYTDVGQMVRQVYGSASKERCTLRSKSLPAITLIFRSDQIQVHSVTAQLNTSQSAIINASHSIRLILEDLKAVSEKIDIITSCQILPEIKINNPACLTSPTP